MGHRITSTDPEPFLDRVAAEAAQDPDAMAEIIAAKTDLGQDSGLLIAFSHLGYDADDIGDEIGRRGSYVDEKLGALRARRASIDEELEQLERTAAALREI